MVSAITINRHHDRDHNNRLQNVHVLFFDCFVDASVNDYIINRAHVNARVHAHVCVSDYVHVSVSDHARDHVNDRVSNFSDYALLLVLLDFLDVFKILSQNFCLQCLLTVDEQCFKLLSFVKQPSLLLLARFH